MHRINILFVSVLGLRTMKKNGLINDSLEVLKNSDDFDLTEVWLFKKMERMGNENFLLFIKKQ